MAGLLHSASCPQRIPPLFIKMPNSPGQGGARDREEGGPLVLLPPQSCQWGPRFATTARRLSLQDTRCFQRCRLCTDPGGAAGSSGRRSGGQPGQGGCWGDPAQMQVWAAAHREGRKGGRSHRGAWRAAGMAALRAELGGSLARLRSQKTAVAARGAGAGPRGPSAPRTGLVVSPWCGGDPEDQQSPPRPCPWRREPGLASLGLIMFSAAQCGVREPGEPRSSAGGGFRRGPGRGASQTGEPRSTASQP